jgi:hypothetical protein
MANANNTKKPPPGPRRGPKPSGLALTSAQRQANYLERRRALVREAFACQHSLILFLVDSLAKL